MQQAPQASVGTSQRYTVVAVVLHWLIALAILTMLASGLTMAYGDLQGPFKFQLYQWHKSLGVIVLWLVLIRLAWRLTHKPPALPAAIPHWEQVGAHIGHWLIYAAILVMPLSGWLLVSSSSTGLPTIVFNLFQWPHIPGVAGNRIVHDLAAQTHGWTAWTLIALLGGHVLAVVVHYYKEHVNLLARMWFGGEK